MVILGKTMGLKGAIQAHAKGDLKNADYHYKRALSQNVQDPILYQNYGSLLKSLQRFKDAENVYLDGLKHFPEDTGILRNYGNLLRAIGRQCHSIELYLRVINLSYKEDGTSEIFFGVCDDLIEVLCQRGLFVWCLSCIHEVLRFNKNPSSCILKSLLIITTDESRALLEENASQMVVDIVQNHLESAPLLESTGLDFALAAHYLQVRNLDAADTSYHKALRRIKSSHSIPGEIQDELQKMIDINSWNFACISLPLQNFEQGWKLFEHGLRTPAEGHQRWQRALCKPFSSNVISLWRGESGLNKRILLLEEQAVGDTMMFITLVPTLLDEFKYIGLFVTERLRAICERSFQAEIQEGLMGVFSVNDVKNQILKSESFDYQSPLGSVCQYRFTTLDSYAPRCPIFKADDLKASQLRREYLRSDSHVELLVGISWSGGGRGKRILEKSIDPGLFGRFLGQFKNFRFVDLQYGDTTSQINKWRLDGLDVVHDKRINSLENMDLWLSQVKACDAVLSIANTTIHGAGGLNLPTMCLLSLYSDWRWLVDPSITSSYWYPSVGIARQNKTTNWGDALQLVSHWFAQGCPEPSSI